MIEEKLEEARLRSARRRWWTSVTLLVTISLCGLALYGLSTLDFSAKKNPSVGAFRENSHMIRIILACM